MKPDSDQDHGSETPRQSLFLVEDFNRQFANLSMLSLFGKMQGRIADDCAVLIAPVVSVQMSTELLSCC